MPLQQRSDGLCGLSLVGDERGDGSGQEIGISEELGGGKPAVYREADLEAGIAYGVAAQGLHGVDALLELVFGCRQQALYLFALVGRILETVGLERTLGRGEHCAADETEAGTTDSYTMVFGEGATHLQIGDFCHID